MKKITLIFPGQGSQYVGMGKDLLEFPESQVIFEKANKSLDSNITNLMFTGPAEELKLTENTQPAIVTHSIALFERLKPILTARGIHIEQVLGHSVGEFSALVAAGVISIEDAVKAVKNRGKFMQEATPTGVGKMYAILRVPGDVVSKACLEASTNESNVMAANFNEPNQTVISGHSEACSRAINWIETNFEGRSRAIELNVSAPFHSTLMKSAEVKLSSFLSSIELKENDIPYIANVDAKKYESGTSGEIVFNNLVSQVCGSVLWNQSISKLDSSTIFIEVGPGKVLRGLNKKINESFRTYNLDCAEDFINLLEFLDECNL